MKLRQQFIFAMKLRQHFIRIEAMPTLIFSMKPRQHSTLALAFALKLHQYLHRATSKLHLHRSRANIHEAMLILYLHQSRVDIHLCHEVMTTFYISINFQRQHSLDINGV